MRELINKYYFKALDAYPYNLEEVLENLEYALSYDDQCPLSLGLMGKMYAEQLKQYEKSKMYFRQALAAELYTISLYEDFIKVLMGNEDFQEALDFIAFAVKVKGTDKAGLYYTQSQIYEIINDFEGAMKSLHQVALHAMKEEYKSKIKEDKKRIMKRMKRKLESEEKVVSLSQ